ncbi:MAG: hypothetical protein GOV15_02680 [Candidatus Diapherotrites archaeon]|nr:hypothetical protein [Candidatus Diapherotrites archaeon]
MNQEEKILVSIGLVVVVALTVFVFFPLNPLEEQERMISEDQAALQKQVESEKFNFNDLSYASTLNAYNALDYVDCGNYNQRNITGPDGDYGSIKHCVMAITLSREICEKGAKALYDIQTIGGGRSMAFVKVHFENDQCTIVNQRITHDEAGNIETLTKTCTPEQITENISPEIYCFK